MAPPLLLLPLLSAVSAPTAARRCRPARAGAHGASRRQGHDGTSALPAPFGGYCARLGGARRPRWRAWAAGAGDIVFVREEDRYYFREVEVDAEQLGAAPGDLFELLRLELGASQEEVRAAYRGMQRAVHPDLVGPAAHDMAVLLNKAYAVLGDDRLRQEYAEGVRRFRKQAGGGFTGQPVSTWAGQPGEARAIFVDETTCIGCSHCSMCAPNTFAIEEGHGRARVFRQWGDPEDDVREAIDICPVDCIHYVKRSQLALLEWVLKSCEREDIAIMARRRSGNMGASAAAASPFTRAEIFSAAVRSTKELDAAATTSQDAALAGTIARAFLAMPRDVRAKVWPEWAHAEEAAAAP
mmetsp:Transcript_35354/g.89114  ORF Transcript_35354/g.89114 Transcript_35354/m.89114 type:complete len:354 (-) Transcript_35354:62-1123(-)